LDNKCKLNNGDNERKTKTKGDVKMNKFNLKVAKLSDEDVTHQGGGDFISSCRTWNEEWIVTDEKGRVVDRKIVDRMVTTGHSGLGDNWTYCSNCGTIFHEAFEDYCENCRKY